jgi:hypothetical protein
MARARSMGYCGSKTMARIRRIGQARSGQIFSDRSDQVSRVRRPMLRYSCCYGARHCWRWRRGRTCGGSQ